jgi:hypothetical protein
MFYQTHITETTNGTLDHELIEKKSIYDQKFYIKPKADFVDSKKN